MEVQDLANIRFAMMAQSGRGAYASGSGAVSMDLLASQGLQRQVATIESAMIKRNKMRNRPRHGLASASASYETEHLFGVGPNEVYRGVLGAAAWQAPQTLTEADFTNLSVVAGDTADTQKVRRNSGSWFDDDYVRGMVFRLSLMSTAANNGVWTPVASISANGLDLIVPAGYLTNQAADTDCAIERAAYVVTPAAYAGDYFTVEEKLAEIAAAKRGKDMRLNALNFSGSAEAMCKLGFGFGGAGMDTVSDEVFTDPDFTDDANSFHLDDGIVLVDGLPRADLRELTFGISAPTSGMKVIGSRESLDTFLGQFAFTGQVTAALLDDSLLQMATDEDVIDVIAFCKHQTRQRFVSFCIGEATFAGFSSPAGGDGGAVQTLGLYAGDNTRGAGHHGGTLLISTGDDS